MTERDREAVAAILECLNERTTFICEAIMDLNQRISLLEIKLEAVCKPRTVPGRGNRPKAATN